MNSNDWIFNTLGIGILPYTIRLIIILALESAPSSNLLLSEFDFIAFCLIVNVSNINHVNNMENISDIIWKKVIVRSGLFFVIVCLVFYTILIMNDLRDLGNINVLFLKYGAVALTISSLLLTFSIRHKLSK